MSKIMLVCSRCGFAAFVSGEGEVAAAGWSIEIRLDGARFDRCPGCRKEAATADKRDESRPALVR
jgi:hypothetical protein